MKNQISLPLLLLLFLLSSCTEPEQQVEKKPNVVFILADDLGYYDLSCMGSKYYETPNIDKIANNGMIFTNGYAACQVCSPSRASIMTGKFPARHGITDWIGARTGEAWRTANRHDKLLPADYVPHLPHEDLTLAEAMKTNGYKTFFSGKWHLGSEGSYPEDHGFDINKGGWEKGSPIGGFYSPWTNPKLENHQPGESLTKRLAKETVTFIEQHKDTSFFAFLSFYAVHSPIQTTEEKWKKYQAKAKKQGIAGSGFIMERVLPIRQHQDNPIYAGLIETMDEAVGLVLDALKNQGLEDNTIVIFTSDNGGVSSGDNFSTSNLPFRGGKGYQWEGGIREPYFIKVPWMEQEGRKTEVPATGTDFYPTILDLAGLELQPQQHLDGHSLLPVLEGKSIEDRPLYWHYPHYGNQGGEPSSIILEGDWKLIHYYEDGRSELYNIKTDIGEQNDQSEDKPELAAQLYRKLKNWLDSVGAVYPEKDPEYNAALDEERDQNIRNELWPRLEKQRKAYLSDGFDPQNDWWASKVTKD